MSASISGSTAAARQYVVHSSVGDGHCMVSKQAGHHVGSFSEVAWQQRPRLVDGTSTTFRSQDLSHPPFRPPMTRYLRVIDRGELFAVESTCTLEVTDIGSYSCHSSSTSSDTRIVVPAKPPVYIPRTDSEDIHLTKELR